MLAVPTNWGLKATFVSDALTPGEFADIPIPAKSMVCVPLGALLDIEIVPMASPTAVGRKLIDKEQAAPVTRVAPMQFVVPLNEPERVMLLIVSGCKPLLSICAVSVVELPVGRLP